MSKLFQKIKKWISGLTAVLLFVSILAPSLVSASPVLISVTPLTTNDTTPTLTGSVSDVTAEVTITIDSDAPAEFTYTAVNDGVGGWSLDVADVLTAGYHDVEATDGANVDLTKNELLIDIAGPVLVEKTPVSANGYTGDSTPVYVFSTDEPGTIAYEGSCGDGDLVNVIKGDNAVTFGPLTDGKYSDCSITVMDAQNNSTVLGITPYIVDTDAPILYSPKDYQELLVESSVVEPEVTENLLSDEGIYLAEDYQEADIATSWKLVDKTATDVATYEVTYTATDLAGNDSNPVKVTVSLGTDEIVGNGQISVALNGKASVKTERNSVYTDAGAHLAWDSEIVHIWTAGDLNLGIVNEYSLGYLAEVPAELVPATINKVDSKVAVEVEYRTIEVIDTVGPTAVKNLTAYAGSGYIQLNWDNPTNDDFAGLAVYRTCVKGGKWILLTTLETDAVSYDDYEVTNGKTYYYTVLAYDSYGNNSKYPVTVSATPKAPKIVSSSYVVYEEPAIEDVEDQSVKSDEKVNDNSDTETKSTAPTVGIIILILLIALGLYLLYLQNPEMFKKFAFWKRNKKGGIVLSRKKKNKTNIKKK